jgi:hypothetical protein
MPFFIDSTTSPRKTVGHCALEVERAAFDFCLLVDIRDFTLI